MSKVRIGKRKPVENLTDLWAKEPNFSNWLATQEGIELLAADLGVEIENPQREVKAANYLCDIVATLVGDEEHFVVIENQFGRTDHEHLGKLLTYAATHAHNSTTAIWIAEEVSDDHRQAIDWLNENTPDSVMLYLAEIKAYTIGESPAAPQLDVVCRPNILIKPVKGGQTIGEQKRREWRKEFWTVIHDRLKKGKPSFRVQRAGPDHWSTISVGRTGFGLNMLLTPKNQSIAVEIVIQPREWKESAFNQLRTQSKAIENEIGHPLDWREMPGQRSSRIILEEEINPDVEGNRERVCDWFEVWTPKIFLTFQDRIKKLKAPEEP